MNTEGNIYIAYRISNTNIHLDEDYAISDVTIMKLGSKKECMDKIIEDIQEHDYNEDYFPEDTIKEFLDEENLFHTANYTYKVNEV